MSDRQAAALDKAGAFFAFSTKQFDEQKKPDIVYMNGPAGMICPKDTIFALLTELETIYTDSIKQDIEENGLNAIIRRELNNHEAYYTNDIESTAQALTEYPITRADILAVFKNKNHEIDMRCPRCGSLTAWRESCTNCA